MNEFRKKIAAWLAENSESMVADIQAFARIRSVSRADLAQENAPFGPECREMLDFALAHARKMGFETQDHEGYCGSVIMGDGVDCIGIVAHLDVVPEGDKWIYPPYAATRVGDFLIGRGVSDNKSPAIMGLYIMKMFRELGIELKHGMRLILGCSEETGMQDLRYYRQHYPEPKLSLIPDSGFPANYAQKGSMSGKMRIALGDGIASFTGGEVSNMVPPHAQAILNGISAETAAPKFGEGFTVEACESGCIIKAQGIAAHAAHPEGGKSAINMLASAIAQSGLVSGQSLKAMNAVAEMTGDYYGSNAGIANEDPDTGKTTMVCGVAAMKNGKMTLSLDCRLSLAANSADDIAAFTAYAEKLGFEAYAMSSTPPVYMPKDDPRMQTVTKLYNEITGSNAEPYTMGGGTYSRELSNAITFGPGFPDFNERPEGLPEHHGGAHAPDEYMHIPSFLRAFEIYACTVKALDDVI